jgi:CRISPR-associated protein Csx3
MSTYNVALVEGVLKIGFGSPAQNDQIVKDAFARLDEMTAAGERTGGRRGDPGQRPGVAPGSDGAGP